MHPEDFRIGTPGLAGSFVEVPRAIGVEAPARARARRRASPRNRHVADVPRSYRRCTPLLAVRPGLAQAAALLRTPAAGTASSCPGN